MVDEHPPCKKRKPLPKIILVAVHNFFAPVGAFKFFSTLRLMRLRVECYRFKRESMPHGADVLLPPTADKPPAGPTRTFAATRKVREWVTRFEKAT